MNRCCPAVVVSRAPVLELESQAQGLANHTCRIVKRRIILIISNRLRINFFLSTIFSELYSRQTPNNDCVIPFQQCKFNTVQRKPNTLVISQILEKQSNFTLVINIQKMIHRAQWNTELKLNLQPWSLKLKMRCEPINLQRLLESPNARNMTKPLRSYCLSRPVDGLLEYIEVHSLEEPLRWCIFKLTSLRRRFSIRLLHTNSTQADFRSRPCQCRN